MNAHIAKPVNLKILKILWDGASADNKEKRD